VIGDETLSKTNDFIRSHPVALSTTVNSFILCLLLVNIISYYDLTSAPPEHPAEAHITDHDLERYYLGMVKDEAELAALEEHILACGSCAERAEQTQDYVDAVRLAALDLCEAYEYRR
jgi:hypothetical protein